MRLTPTPMTLEEAQRIHKLPWKLPCGHSSDGTKSDYYDSWCGSCGINTDGLRPPEEHQEALRVINEDYDKRKRGKTMITEQVEIDIKRFLEYNPYGTIEEFYNYIITTK